jgi:hypothetical protein
MHQLLRCVVVDAVVEQVLEEARRRPQFEVVIAALRRRVGRNPLTQSAEFGCTGQL